MDTAENSARPQALPSKLRWRPYSTAAKRQKKDDASPQGNNSSSALQSQNQALGLQAKALAHRVREKSFRSAKTHNPPVGVQLQWEEAETMESMSRGGHPHNQHPPPYNYQRQQHQQQQLQQQQERRRNLSDSNSDTDSDSYSSSHRPGVSSLPSPTPSKSPATPVRSQLGEDLDLSHYKARLPGLTGDDFLDHGLPLPSIEANTVYQVAVNELLENHRRNMLAEKAPALAITSATNPSRALADSTSQRQRRLSSSELLGISTIEELLVSCGYSEPVGNFTGDTLMRIPVSPATTDQSLHPSPASGIIDLQDTSMMTKTPLDISSASFDLLMAQTPVLLSEGDSKHILLQQQQQQQAFAMDYLQNGLGWASASTPSPFAHVATTHDDPLINGNDSSFLSNWPSLFPKIAIGTQSIAREGNNTSAAPRVDIAIQTDPLSPPLSGTSTESSPATTHVDLTQEELNPDWLTFLEETSPLFPAVTESSGESPEHSSPSTFTTDSVSPPSSSTTTPTTASRKAESVAPPVREKGAWNWAEDFLKQGAMAPTGHRSFPTAGSFGSFSSGGGGIGGGGGGGGMIRTLRGAGGIGGGSGPRTQQRSAYHTQASSRNSSAATTGSRTSNSGVGNSRNINAASVDERVKKEESQAKTTAARIPNESTMHMQKENKVSPTAAALEKESPGKKISAEEETMRGKAKACADTTTAPSKKLTTTTTTTTEGFGGLLAMFRGLWKGNGGDKNGS
ncbi:hypothetical protein BGZ95_008648 [Linnemannia exigua]|uniref:Uncharacterized protein n=1 Tax=Linnemannia exigua TaxID=604196 RepID=A0AAD4DDY6_9FUNG|nr:hypothetical protein BGZ95_008648 [Linnemannia exigua]